MRTRIVSITILSLLLLSGTAPGCSEHTEKTMANGEKKISEKKEMAVQKKNEPETAHIILQFRGCKAHQ
jgi:hypothetical protein